MGHFADQIFVLGQVGGAATHDRPGTRRDAVLETRIFIDYQGNTVVSGKVFQMDSTSP